MIAKKRFRIFGGMMILVLTGFSIRVTGEGLQPGQESHAEPQANLADFQRVIAPIIQKSCLDCHGPKK